MWSVVVLWSGSECCGCGVKSVVECGVLWSVVGHCAWPQCVSFSVWRQCVSCVCVNKFGKELAGELERAGVITAGVITGAASEGSPADALQELMKQKQQELQLEAEQLAETITDASVHVQARQGELSAVRSN